MPLNSVLGTQARVWWHVSDLTDYLNSLDLPSGMEAVDITTFGHDNVVEDPAPGGATVGFGGFASYGATEIDAVFSAAFAAQTQSPLTVSLGGNLRGARALLAQGRGGTYSHGVAVGEMQTIDGEILTRLGLRRGYLLAALAAVSGAGTTFTTPVDFGAQSTGGYDATLHVSAASGSGSPSLTVTVQTSATAGGTYVDAFSFTVVSGTTPTSEYKSADGVTLDRWRRLKIVEAGTSPAYTFGVALASRV